jgi:DNA-binding Xre family transcriptional regulator
MIKSYLEFKQVEEAIKIAEEVLMRKLSDDEKEMIIVRGFQALMESLEVSPNDWEMLSQVKRVLQVYTSNNEDEFMEVLKQTPEARDFFEFIVAAYDAANDVTNDDEELCTDPYNTDAVNEQESVEDPVLGAIERMKNGETVDLDNEMMNKVCAHLTENFMNYFFRSVNGQSSLKVN